MKIYTPNNLLVILGEGFADAVATGTASVFLAIAALNLPKGSHVLVSPITDPGTVSAIILNNLIPKLVDTENDSYNVSLKEVVNRITDEVSAAVIVHATGQVCDIQKISDELKNRKIFLIEDCSQSHGAHIQGKQVGTFGDIAAFSTMYRKNHITGGSGGVVYTKNEELFHMALAHADRGKPRWMEDFDDRNPEHFLFPALNWNANELSCAIGISSLKRLPETILKRTAYLAELAHCMSRYNSIFRMGNWKPSGSPFIQPIYVDAVSSKKSAKDVALALMAEGIELNPCYKYVVSEWSWAKKFMADNFDTPNAKKNRNNSFCLYLNENYTSNEASDVADAMYKVSNGYARTI